MQTNPIPGVMDTLREAGFNEEQRMAITGSIIDMQYPLLDAIEKLENRISNQTLVLATLIITSQLGMLALLKFGMPG